MTKNYNVLDLFCGCGGMTKGLEDAGLNIIAGIDIWDKAIASYIQNYKHQGICEDITKLSPKEFQQQYNKSNTNIDIIVGGPPCQGFSMAGKRDKKDPRNSLFMEFVKYIDYFTPIAFIMENVIGILSMRTKLNEKVIDIVMNKFENNYNCVICKLYASDFGVPQNRRRVIIIGVRKDLNIVPKEPKPRMSKNERKPVSDVLLEENEIDNKYFLSKKAIDGIVRRKKICEENGKGFGALPHP